MESASTISTLFAKFLGLFIFHVFHWACWSFLHLILLLSGLFVGFYLYIFPELLLAIGLLIPAMAVHETFWSVDFHTEVENLEDPRRIQARIFKFFRILFAVHVMLMVLFQWPPASWLETGSFEEIFELQFHWKVLQSFWIICCLVVPTLLPKLLRCKIRDLRSWHGVHESDAAGDEEKAFGGNLAMCAM